MKKILIIGATSAIAGATARLFAERGDALYLVGRNNDKLQVLAGDLRVRGRGQVVTEELDLNDMAAHEAMIARATAALQGLDAALIAHGTLSDQSACQASVEMTLMEIKTNALSAISLLTLLANIFEAQKQGCIAVISSVAGDRGRQSNYVYGSAKAMVTAFLSGLRQRLAKAGVSVVTVKPGFVDTPMTSGFKKGPLWAVPEKVAADIVHAMDGKGGEIYTPWFWRFIMLIIRHIPEVIFKRLRL